MGTEWRTLEQGVVPLDGTGLTTADPTGAAGVRLTLSGELSLPDVGLTVDAVDADTPSSLIQIDPGQWHMVEAKPDVHRYVFVPTAPVTEVPVVRIDLHVLEERFGFSQQEASDALTGKLSVELSALAPDSGSPVHAAVLLGALLLLAGAAVVALRTRRRRVVEGDDTDLESVLEEIRSLAQTLDERAKAGASAVPKVVRDIDVLVASAERLCGSTRVLRRQLRSRGMEPVGAEAPQGGEAKDGLPHGKVPDRDRAILEPLVAEEQRLGERLQRIRNALAGLLEAWDAVDAAQEHESDDAEALLEEAKAEITAVLVSRGDADQGSE